MWLTSCATWDASHCSLSLGEAASGQSLNRLLQGWVAARCVLGTLIMMAAGVCSAATGLSRAPSGVAAAIADELAAAEEPIALGEPLFETGDSIAACRHSMRFQRCSSRHTSGTTGNAMLADVVCRGCNAILKQT